MRKETKRDDGVETFIERASEVAGGISAAAIGLFVGDGAGAVTGAASAPLLIDGLRRVGRDIRRRVLSGREEIRVGVALSYAAASIRARLDAGSLPRSDGFFEQQASAGRSSADEVLEGILFVAQRQYEERKLPFIGHLFASIAFDDQISPQAAHALLRLIERLSYRQLVLLALFGSNTEENPFGLRAEMYGPGADEDAPSLGHEIFELHQLSLVYRKTGEDSAGAVFGPTEVGPAQTQLEGLARILFRAARLKDVSAGELDEMATSLGAKYLRVRQKQG